MDEPISSRHDVGAVEWVGDQSGWGDLEVLGAAPPQTSWLTFLRALGAWPSPERVILERRLVRRGQRAVTQQLKVASGALPEIENAERPLESLLRPLRQTSALRPQRRSTEPLSAGTIAVLAGVGTQSVAASEELLREAGKDLVALPAGAGFGIVVWRAPKQSDEERYRETVARHGAMELQLVGVDPPPLSAAMRVWSPTTLPPALLARLAAAVGQNGDAWQLAEDADTKAAQLEAINKLAIPVIRDPEGEEPDEPRAVRLKDLAALLGTPALTPDANGRRPRIGRPFTGKVSPDGALAGRVLTPAGGTRALRLPWSQRERHLFVCGRTGSGKSELIARLAADDLESDRGLLLIDPHGDLADRVLGLVPEHRTRDVILIEPHHERTAAIPALPPGLAVENQLALLDDAYQELYAGNTFWSGRWRRPAALLLKVMHQLKGVDPSFAGLDLAMDDEEVRAGLQLALRDHPLAAKMGGKGRMDWDRGTQLGAAFTNSAGRFAFDHAPRWDLPSAIRTNSIIIARLDVGHLGAHDAGRMGRVLLRLAFNALASLGSSHIGERNPLSVIVDEAHLFSNGPILGSVLAQARKFGASVTLCSQAPTRLPSGLLTDIMTNCATVLSLQLPRREANAFADLDPAAPEHIAALPRYHAVALLDDDPGGDAPLVIHPIPITRAMPGRATAATAGARRRHGRQPKGEQRAGLGRFAALADHARELGEGGNAVRTLGSLTRSAKTIPPSEELERLIDATLEGENC